MQDDTQHPSPDDALEEERRRKQEQSSGADDVADDEVDEDEVLPEDNDSPAAPANSPSGNIITEDDPETDSGLDDDEVYEQGAADALDRDDDTANKSGI